MGSIRRAAVAGRFYPDDAARLTSTIENLLAAAERGDGPPPKALIAPHAGYVYSGPIAASAYARVRASADCISRVILLGPCHRVAVQGVALSSADYFETPLGTIEIDQLALQEIRPLPQVTTFDQTHELEHSLEVHLPFLQVILGQFQLVPLVVGETSPAVVRDVLETVWGGDETLVVVSSDLSHYLDYDSACERDRQTALAIENLTADQLDRASACGRFPVSGLLELARTRDLQVTRLDLRNSGDTAGSRDRVVGYGAWMFTAPPAPTNADKQTAAATSTENTSVSRTEEHNLTLEIPPTKSTPTQRVPSPSPSATSPDPAGKIVSITLTPDPVENSATTAKIPPQPANPAPPAAVNPDDRKSEQEFEQATRALIETYGPDLMLLAALAIDDGFDSEQPMQINPANHPAALRTPGACFVTLRKNGELRGCIGSAQAHRPLVEDVVANAYRAAFADSRFAKLLRDEREQVEISISLLSPPVPMAFTDERDFLTRIRPGIDGLIIEDRGLRSLFLPSVWSQLPDRSDFIGRLKVKAGLSWEHWSPTFRAQRFIAVEISSHDLA